MGLRGHNPVYILPPIDILNFTRIFKGVNLWVLSCVFLGVWPPFGDLFKIVIIILIDSCWNFTDHTSYSFLLCARFARTYKHLIHILIQFMFIKFKYFYYADLRTSTENFRWFFGIFGDLLEIGVLCSLP